LKLNKEKCSSKAALFVLGVIELDYDIDSDQITTVENRLQPLINITKSKKVWRIVEASKVIDKKYTGGATASVKRTPCKASTKATFPFRVNHDVASFKLGKETLLFLPDMLFIIKGNKIGALSYADFDISFGTTRFVESEAVPKDATVVGHTWKYVNKSGGPDKRFKDNKELPICLYGEVLLTSASGLNTVIMYSNSSL